MTEQPSQQFMHDAEIAERYVTGPMPDAERIAFEDHFVACAQCQRDIRFASAVRTAHAGVGATPAVGVQTIVRTGAHASPPHASSARRRRSRRRIAAWAGAALAAGIAAILIVRAAPSHAVIALGEPGDAPVYLGIAVRSAAGRGETIFVAAMNEYAARRYAAASHGLQAALAAGEDSIPTEFFIGASFLYSGHAKDAADAFARVLAKGDSPYADEAQLYRAKALLHLGRGNDALAVLASRTPADAATAARLSALADSVKRADAR